MTEHKQSVENEDIERAVQQVIFKTSPTIRPVLIWFGFVFLVAAILLSYLAMNPTVFGDPELTQIVFWVISLLFGLVLIRFAVKMFILTRTNYIVTEDDIRREFDLLYRRNSRELPVEKIRGLEFSQSRIQSLLGYGSLSFLAGGTNQSLGFVEFEHMVEPHKARDHIRELISRPKKDHIAT